MILPLPIVMALMGLTFVLPFAGMLTLFSLLILGDRQGGHLHTLVGGLSLYITEAVMFALLLRALMNYRTIGRSLSRWEWPWKGFYAVSSLSAVRGLLLYAPMQVIRDAALVYYSFFTHVFQRLVSRDIRKLERAAIWLAHVVLLKAILSYSPWKFFYQEGSAVAMYCMCTVLFSLATIPLWSRAWWWYAATTFLTYQTIVIVFRSAWCGFVIGILFFAGALYPRFSTRHKLAVCLILIVGIALGFAYPPRGYFEKPIGRTDLSVMTATLRDNVKTMVRHRPVIVAASKPAVPLASATSKALAPASVVRPTTSASSTAAPKHNAVLAQVLSLSAGIQSDNSSTRLWLAQDLIEELFDVCLPMYQQIRLAPEALTPENRAIISRRLQAPIILESERPDSWRKRLGWGNVWWRRLFGIPFGKLFLPPRLFYWMDKTTRYDPHDSFLSVLYRTGTIGFLFFVSLILFEARRSWERIAHLSNDHAFWMLGLWTAFIGFCGEALFSVSLENPFKGVFFWVFLGSIRALNRLGKDSKA